MVYLLGFLFDRYLFLLVLNHLGDMLSIPDFRPLTSSFSVYYYLCLLNKSFFRHENIFIFCQVKCITLSLIRLTCLLHFYWTGVRERHSHFDSDACIAAEREIEVLFFERLPCVLFCIDNHMTWTVSVFEVDTL